MSINFAVLTLEELDGLFKFAEQTMAAVTVEKERRAFTLPPCPACGMVYEIDLFSNPVPECHEYTWCGEGNGWVKTLEL